MNKQKGCGGELFGFPFKPQPKEDCLTKECVDGMATREGIREGIRHLCFEALGSNSAMQIGIEEKILSYLHSQGVVIKVDKELPIAALHVKAFIGDNQMELLGGVLDKAGFVATEPLIKE